jgi:hypothetical protein
VRVKRLAVLAFVVAAAAPGSLEALPVPCGGLCVRLTETGPTPAYLESWPGQRVWFMRAHPTQPSEVSFAAPATCRPQFAPTGAGACHFTASGTYSYAVTGFGAGHGTIVVRTVEWVTLRPLRAVVAYGRGVRFSGRVYVPPHDGGPPPPPYLERALLGRPADGPETSMPVQFAPDYSLSGLTPAHLEWSAILRPRIATAYVASWRGERSPAAEIDVRPWVEVRRAGRRLAIAVRPAGPWRGRHARLQRRAPDGSWLDVARIGLSGAATATVRIVPRGAPVRVYVPAAPGYVPGWSRTITF